MHTCQYQYPETIQFIVCNQPGEKVEIIRKTQSTGKHKFIWNAEGLPAGVYFCVLKTNNKLQTTKMIKLQILSEFSPGNTKGTYVPFRIIPRETKGSFP
jgi:hypothetical protein